MPALTPDDRTRLLGPLDWRCLTCDGHPVRHYCRSCDEFFFTCRCPDESRALVHLAHWVYLWTPGGVVARPDFDQ